MTASLDEHPDRHVWTFYDHRVTQLVVEPGAVRIATWTLHASLDVRLAAPFTIRQADGDDRRADPDEPEQLAPLLTLVGRWLETMTATTGAELELAFSDGTLVTARRAARDEAWQVQGGGGLEGITYVARPNSAAPPWTL